MNVAEDESTTEVDDDESGDGDSKRVDIFETRRLTIRHPTGNFLFMDSSWC
jgi:hypothetical protein